MSTSSSNSHQDDTASFFHALSRAKTDTPSAPLATPAYRRRVGILLGIIISLMYGFVSQCINMLALPDVPFSQHPPGLIGNFVIFVLCGIAIGFVCAASKSSIDGAFRASGVAVLAVIVQWLVANPVVSDNSLLTFTTLFGLGLLYILAIPAMLLLRLAIDNQTEALNKPAWAWARIRVPLGILVLVSIAGAFSIYPDHVRAGFTDLQALIQTGLAVRDSADLPPALREENNVSGFLDFATADYTLDLSSDFDLQGNLSLKGEVGNAIIVAYFKRGGIVACAYSPLGRRLRCRSYITATFFQRIG
jgi:hypothetical protein